MIRIKRELERPLIDALSSPSPLLPFVSSLATILKSLPPACDHLPRPDARPLLIRPPPDLPHDYLSFVRQCITEIFPKGFDEHYSEYVMKTVPPKTACFETKKSLGGQRLSWDHDVKRFRRMCFKMEPISTLVRFSSVPSAGKHRSVSIHSNETLVFKPLHKLLYDKLSKMKWLLRGTPKKQSFLDAGFKTGALTQSIDYSAATDNLSVEVAEEIVTSLARLSCRPETWQRFLPHLRPLVDDTHLLSRGQLMGSLLSFPLLCLQNRIAFLYATRGIEGPRFPCLINGDDLVMQLPQWAYERFLSVLPQLGMSANLKKTMVSDKYLTINSTYFSTKFTVLPILRIPERPNTLHDFVRVLNKTVFELGSNNLSRRYLALQADRHKYLFRHINLMEVGMGLKTFFRLPSPVRNRVARAARFTHDHVSPPVAGDLPMSTASKSQAAFLRKDKSWPQVSAEEVWTLDVPVNEKVQGNLFMRSLKKMREQRLPLWPGKVVLSRPITDEYRPKKSLVKIATLKFLRARRRRVEKEKKNVFPTCVLMALRGHHTCKVREDGDSLVYDEKVPWLWKKYTGRSLWVQ